MARNTSRLKNTDFEILYTGESVVKGSSPTVDSPPFGETEKDYIEMIVSTTTGTMLDSFVVARGEKVNEHLDSNGGFVKINPGVFLREKGYFSGDYNIEFNFLREVAGSVDDIVLLDKDNKSYDGPMFIDDDGNILKSEIEIIDDEEVVKPVDYDSDILLREVSLKYYIDEISSDRTELRLLPFSIDDKVYKQEFKGIGKEKIVITYDNTLSGPEQGADKQNAFKILDYENMDDKLIQSFIGGELIVSDAYEIMDLTDIDENVNFLVGENVGKGKWKKNAPTITGGSVFGSGLGGSGMSAASAGSIKAALQKIAPQGFLTWGDNWGGLVRGQHSQNHNHRIHGGDNNFYVDVPNANHPVSELRGGYIKDFVVENDSQADVDWCLFEGIGQGTNSDYTSKSASSDFMTKRGTLGLGPDRRLFLGGAAILGYDTYYSYGFPLWIRAKGELTKLTGAKLTINIDGEVIGDVNNVPKTKFTGTQVTTFNGENTFVRIVIPMNTEMEGKIGARAGVLVNLSIKFEHKIWTGHINRKNVFAIAPNDGWEAYENFVSAGFNGGRR